MNNRTDKNISSKHKGRRIFRNLMTLFNILLLIAAVVMAVMVLTGCSPKETEPETYPEAEAQVQKEIEEFKDAEPNDKALEEFMKAAGDFSEGAMLEGYIEKVQDFDYEILGSGKSSEEDDEVWVRVKISTYDFANEYLKAWNEYMEVSESNRWSNQFFSHLLLRLASVSSKDYVSEVQVMCKDEGDGKYTTDFRTNEAVMDALSGGMIAEIKKLMTDDVIMDEEELRD